MSRNWWVSKLFGARTRTIRKSHSPLAQKLTVSGLEDRLTPAPVLQSFTRQPPLPGGFTSADSLVFRATFDQDTLNVDEADFVPNGTTATVQTVGAIIGSSVFDITVSGGDLAGLNGLVGIDLASTQNITDLGSDPLINGEPATDETYTVDNSAPTVVSFVRQVPTGSPTNADSLTFRATFSEDVTGVDGTSFAVTGTTAGYVVNVIDAKTYDVVVSGGDLDNLNGVVGLDVAAGGTVVDLAGNALTVAEPVLPADDQTYSIDNTPPTLTSVNSPTFGHFGAGVNLDFVVEFDDNVTVLGTPQLQLTIGAASKLADYFSGTGTSSLTFRYTIQAGDNDDDGIATTSPVLLNGGSIRDAAGNDSTLTFVSPDTSGVIVDTTPPSTVSFVAFSPASPTNADSVIFRVNFSEAVTGVDKNDFKATGIGPGDSISLTPVDGKTYDITVSGPDFVSINGTVGLDFAATVTIADLAGNALPNAEPGIDQTFTLDNIAPTFTITSAAADPTTTSPIPVVVQFTEDVSGFDELDLTSVNGIVSNFVVFSPSKYTFDLTPAGDGLVSVTVPANVAADAAGNTNADPATLSRNYSAPGLTVALDGNGSLVVTDSKGAVNKMAVVVTGANYVISDAAQRFADPNNPAWVRSADFKTITIPVADVTGPEVIFDLLAGADVLTVDYSGQPFPDAITFKGGDPAVAPGDALRIVGTGLKATYTPSATTTGNGTIAVTGNNTITFTGLEPVDFDVLNGTLTLSLPNGDDLVDIADSTLIDGVTPALKVSGKSGGVIFEDVRVRTSAIVIDTTVVAGVDKVTVASATVGGNTDLTVNTGTEAGDQVAVTGAASFSNNVSITTENVTSTAAGTVATGKGLTIDITGTASTLSGAIGAIGVAVNETGGLVKQGTGTLTLDAVNTYTGATTLTAGKLFLTAAASIAANGNVTVNGGTLGGQGTILSPTTVNAPGTVAPGIAGPGILNTNNVTFTANSTLAVELNGLTVGTQYDQLNVVGTVDLGGATLAATRGFFPAVGSAFVIVNNDGADAVTGQFAQGTSIVVGGITFNINYAGGDGNDVVITVLNPIEVYVDDSWAGTLAGTNPANNPVVGGLLFGYNAFDTITGGIGGAAASGTVTVFGGTYNETVNVNKVLNPFPVVVNSTIPAETVVSISKAVTLTNSAAFSLAAVNTATLVAAAADLVFASTVDGPGVLDVTGTGNLTFAGAVGTVPLASLTTAATLASTKIAANVTTVGAQTYNGTVTLTGAATTAASTTGGAISFNKDVTGGANLVVNTGGVTTFAGNVNVLSLATDFAGAVGEKTAFGNLGTATTTFGTQTYGDDVVVTGDRTFQSTDGGGKAVTFSRSLTGASNVGVATLGDTAFNGQVNVTSLVTSGGGVTNVNGGGVQTVGQQQYLDAVAVGAGATFTSTNSGLVQFNSTLTGANSVAVNTAGQTQFNGAVAVNTLVTDAPGSTRVAHAGTSQTAGLQQYNDAVVIELGSATFQSTAGNVQFESTLTSSGGATVNAANLSVFNGEVNLQSLTVNGPGTTQVGAQTIRTVNDQVYNEPVTLTKNALFTATGNVTFASILNGNFAATVTTGATTTFNGAIDVGSLTVNGGGSTVINTGSVSATNDVTFDDAVATGTDVTFTSRTSNVVFNQTLTNTNKAVAVNSPGVTRFAAAVNVGSLATDGAGTTQVNGGSVTTSGAQSYGDAVTVGQGTTFLDNNGGNVTFGQSLGGGQAVLVQSSGTTSFNGPVALSSLETDAPGATNVNGGAVTTTQAMTFRDPVSLGAATTFTGGGNILFAQTLNGGAAVVVNNPATTTFQGAVNVGSLETDAAGSTTVAGGSVATSGSQVFNDPVSVTANTTFAAGGNVAFNSSLTGGVQIVVNSPGETRFGGPVNVGTLTTDGAGSSVIATGGIAANGDIVFSDPVRLDASSRVVSTNGGITFQQAVTAPGGTSPSLNTSAANGNVTFAGPVLLGGGSTLQIEQARNVALNNGLVAGRLQQDAGSGTTTLAGSIQLGGSGALLATNRIVLTGQMTSAGDVTLVAAGGGVEQTAGSSLVVPTLGLYGSGTFTLDQPGNDVRTGLRMSTGGGPVRVFDANDLTVDSAAGGIVTANQNVTLRAGTNFTAVDHRKAGEGRYSTPGVNLGSGVFTVEPGLSGAATVKFDVEIQAARAVLGSQTGGNTRADNFTVRPSATTPITSFGSDPTGGANGDRFFPVFDGTPVLQFTYDGEDGFYLFQGRAKLDFFNFESLDQLSFTGFVVQTGEPGDPQNNVQVQYAVRVIRTQAGQVLRGGLEGSAILENRFVISPSRVNPVSPSLAPRITFGDVNGDGAVDLIIANGPGTSPLVTVINGNRLNENERGQLLSLDAAALEAVTNPDLARTNPAVLTQFYAYEPTFFGGVNVAVGDFDGDGRAEIITGADVGGGARVRRFALKDATGRYPLEAVSTDDFMTFEESYRGGVRVAVGDINNDGVPDLILGAGTEGGPRVTVLDGKAHRTSGQFWGNNGANWTVLANFFAYDPNFRGGVFVDAGDFNGDGFADILTGPGVGSSHIRVFSGKALTEGTGRLDLASFFAFGSPITDPLYNVTGAIQEVGSVAFGATSVTNGFRSILVSTGRGPKVKVQEYAGSADGVSTVTDPNTRPDGNLITDTNVRPIPVPTDKLNYGATVAGFTQQLTK